MCKGVNRMSYFEINNKNQNILVNIIDNCNINIPIQRKILEKIIFHILNDFNTNENGIELINQILSKIDTRKNLTGSEYLLLNEIFDYLYYVNSKSNSKKNLLQKLKNYKNFNLVS